MLDIALKEQLKVHFEKLSRPVIVTASLDSGEKSKELKSLLEDLAETSQLVSVVYEKFDKAPSFTLKTPSKDIHIRFSGVPLGHEFTSLILAILQVGGSELKISKETIEQIKSLAKNEFLNFKVYISLSCQNCPDVVQALNLMSVINPNIYTEMIDGACFQEEMERKQIMSVPYVELNGFEFGQGRMTLEDIIYKLDDNNGNKQKEDIDAKEPFDVLILGAGPAGISSAIYSARKGVRVGIVAERLGGQILDTASIENFISVKHTEGASLARNLESHFKEHDIDFVSGILEEVVPKHKNETDFIQVKLRSGATLKSKTLIVATGAQWRQLGIKGEKEYKGKGVNYCPHCDGPLFKGKRVAVVGGGNSGVEAAIDLSGIASHVTLLEFAPVLKADFILQSKLKRLNNVDVLTSVVTEEIFGENGKVSSLRYENKDTNEVHNLDLDGVFVQIGLSPNSHFMEGVVELNKMKEIIVDKRNQTSVDGIFGAGDVTDVPYKQIVVSVGEGAKAALSAFDYLMRNN